MVDAEDLWSEIIDSKETGKGKFSKSKMITKPTKEVQSDSEDEEWILDVSDYADIGEDEDDSDEE